MEVSDFCIRIFVPYSGMRIIKLPNDFVVRFEEIGTNCDLISISRSFRGVRILSKRKEVILMIDTANNSK